MQESDLTVVYGKKVAFLSLGCKVNSYETDRMKEQFAGAGADIRDLDMPGADVVIINTCSVTNIADRKSRQMLHKARKLSPDALIVAAGCYSEAQGEKIVIDGDADISIGNDRKDSVLQAVACELIRRSHDSKNPENVCAASVKASCGPGGIISDHTRAFIKIEDGCNQFCSYCIIPYVRGRVRSRTEEDVLSEIIKLSQSGFKEVVLTGIHLSSYGIDRYEAAAASGFDHNPLIELVLKASETEGIERIRLGSLEPRIINEEFVKSLSSIPKVCPQFHLSLQSGSDSVLKRMNRHYTTQDYKNAVEILRKYYDRPAITTDIIVGFPGETEKEFEETLKFASEIGFLKIHIFKYSRRKGTVADKMPGQIDENIKNKRSAELSLVDAENRNAYISSFCGEDVDVLFEETAGCGEEMYITGLTTRYVEVRVKADGEEAITNTIRKCHISGMSKEGFLKGCLKK